MPVPVPVPAGYDLTNPDIFRSPNPHVGFGGGGVHFCPGSHLAKLEIDLVFNAIADHVPDIVPAGPQRRLRPPSPRPSASSQASDRISSWSAVSSAMAGNARHPQWSHTVATNLVGRDTILFDDHHSSVAHLRSFLYSSLEVNRNQEA